MPRNAIRGGDAYSSLAARRRTRKVTPRMRKLRAALVVEAWGLKAVHVQQRSEEVSIGFRDQILSICNVVDDGAAAAASAEAPRGFAHGKAAPAQPRGEQRYARGNRKEETEQRHSIKLVRAAGHGRGRGTRTHAIGKRADGRRSVRCGIR